MSIAH